MKYMGGKTRIVKDILPIILKDRTDEWYVEPFAGGMNVVCHVKGNRIASDKHKYLIAFFSAVQQGWKPPVFVTEGEYSSIKIYREDYPPELVGFVGFNSWGATWFGGYPRGRSRDYWLQANLSLIRQKSKLQDVKMVCSDYRDLVIPPKSIVYCDPPYTNTRKYSVGDFDHFYFWKWCRKLVKEGHKVFISEYQAPDDFTCVWSKRIKESLTNTTRLEKLFTYGE